MGDETLFRDTEVFDIDYIPEQFSFRDGQMRELTFSAGERDLLRLIAEESRGCNGILTTGDLFRTAKGRFPSGSSLFHERIGKLENLRIIDTRSARSRGRIREVILRYDAEEVLGL